MVQVKGLIPCPLPEAPVMSIFLSLLHSRMPTVSLPEVGT